MKRNPHIHLTEKSLSQEVTHQTGQVRQPLEGNATSTGLYGNITMRDFWSGKKPEDTSSNGTMNRNGSALNISTIELLTTTSLISGLQTQTVHTNGTKLKDSSTPNQKLKSQDLKSITPRKDQLSLSINHGSPKCPR